MRQARVLVMVLLVMAWPTSAHAARSWWGWLEELSGPGPFTGLMYSHDVRCWDGNKDNKDDIHCRSLKAEIELEPAKRIKKTLQVSFGFLTSGDRARFEDLVRSGQDNEDNHRQVYAIPINATMMFRVHRSLQIGPGIGVLFLAGPDVSASPAFVALPLSASWKFLRMKSSWENSKLARIASLELQTNFITRGYDGRDFGSDVTTFKSKPEFRANVGISIDFREWR
jgi:hypothetical protein